jgi:hypothetical protein
MNEPKLFVLADRTLDGVIAQIGDDQWEREMPVEFMRRGGDHVPTLREIVNYHAYDDAWVPDMLAGRTMDEAGRDRFDGDLLGAEPKQAFSALVDLACAAAVALDDLDGVVHCSFGDYPTRHYFWQVTMFRGLRAHDIARVIGIDHGMSDELVQGLWDEISPHAEEWRTIGVFPARVEVPDGAPLLDQLLGLTGRQLPA